MTQGRCFKCKSNVDIINTHEKTGKNNRKFIIGNCSNGCKRKDGNLVKVSRAVSNKVISDKPKRKYNKSENMPIPAHLRKRKAKALISDTNPLPPLI